MGLIIDEKKFSNQLTVLRAASVVDGELGKRLRESIYNELKDARNRIVGDIKFKNGDPRGTAHAVKRYTAKKYLGGVISILDGKSSGGSSLGYEAPRKVYPVMKGHRGGNRTPRSKRTQDILNLAPQDRGFILRFVNSGTNPRYANGRNVTGNNRNLRNFFRLQEEGDYFRGSIAPRNFFGTIGQREMQAVVSNLSHIIDEEYSKVFNE